MITLRTTRKTLTSLVLAAALAGTPLSGLIGEAHEQDQCPSCAVSTSADAFSTLLESATHAADVSLPQSLLPVILTPHDGVGIQFVQSATGHVSFSVIEMAYQGYEPVTLMRRYNSGQSAAQSGIGLGWSLVYDDFIVVKGATAQLHAASGEIVEMKLNAQANEFEPVNPAGTFHHALRLAEDGSMREQNGDVARIYATDGQVYRLARICSSGDGGSLQISRDRRGRITSLAGGKSRSEISLTWSDDEEPLLLSAKDNTGRSVTYTYDGGYLSVVTDVAGSQWHYFYDGVGQLTRVVDPEGTNVLQVTYAGGRADTSETLRGLTHFAYVRSGNVVNTSASFSTGTVVNLVHNASGQLLSATSKSGSSSRMSYDAAGRLIGADVGPTHDSYGYDDQNRLVFRAAGGRVSRWEYDAEGRVSRWYDGAQWVTYGYPDNQTVTASGPVAMRNFTTRYESGRVVYVSGPAGEQSFTYDEWGQVATATSGVGSIIFQHDAHGWLRHVGLPDGTTTEFTLDARGALSGVRASSGQSLTYERDRRGALVAVSSNDGGWVRATRDRAGRIIRLTNSRQQSRAFSDDQAGRLTTYTNALGQVFRVQFDRQGRTNRMVEERGNRMITRAVRPGSRRREPGPQVRMADVDIDGWYDPDNAEGLLGAFERIRGRADRAAGSSMASALESATSVGGPSATSAASYGDASDCNPGDCQQCWATYILIYETKRDQCIEGAWDTSNDCGLACLLLFEDPELMGYCAALCISARIRQIIGCRNTFSQDYQTIWTLCSVPCGR